MITCSIQVAGRDEEFWCSFIYASNFTEERKILWRYIKAQHTLASSQGKPWAIFGDFNEILDLENTQVLILCLWSLMVCVISKN